MIGFKINIISRRTAIRSAATMMVIFIPLIKATTMTSPTKITPSLKSCSIDRMSPYMLLTSEVMLLWITDVSAFR